ncbi:MAG TPA: M28 family peptidase [Gemmatimonadaceae bacterium]|nr:M28 family peptidase [Gemmatimonadaceae bacterium]
MPIDRLHAWRAMPVMFLLLGACAGARTAGSLASMAPDSARMARDVAWLASDAMEGRATGSAGNDSAAAGIARRFASLGLRPAWPDRAPADCATTALRAACLDGFVQPFVARSVAAAHAGLPAEIPTANVAAMVPGSDPALRDEVVVIGAHMDHLGRSAFNAMDPDAGDAIRNGADDNASGTAVVLELARLFADAPTRRSLLFVTFSGEELGLLGSAWFVDHAPVPPARMQAMLNYDMVGRMREGKLIVYGVESARELRAAVDDAHTDTTLHVTASGDGFGASDHQSFYLRDVPVLHFFTNVHDEYHRATDDAALINAGGMSRVVDFSTRIIRNLADRPARLTLVKTVAEAPSSSTRANTSAWLGSIPDMGAGDVKGVRLSGIRTGSPADSAGLREGDVIVEFDGKPIADLYAYTDALYARAPGDTVKILVERDGARVTVTAVLGRRGQ